MILYPAIDLMGGKCVRLTRGRKEDCTVYSDNPPEFARKWVDAGAKWLHVVDLDATIEQRVFANRAAVRAIVAEAGVPVQLGGGIRKLEHISQYLEDGVSRLILGTSVLESRDFARDVFREFGGKIAVGIDSSNGKVAVKGWTELTELGTVEAALRMRDDGARVIIFTDIRRDGMLTEPNFEMMEEVAEKLGSEVEVIASGGVSRVEHIEKLIALGRPSITGAIVGKALYEGTFDLALACSKFQS